MRNVVVSEIYGIDDNKVEIEGSFFGKDGNNIARKH